MLTLPFHCGPATKFETANVNTRELFDVLKDTPETLGWDMSLFNGTLAQNVSVVADDVIQADLAMLLSQPYRSVDITPPADRMIFCDRVPGQNDTNNCHRVYYMPGGFELAATQKVKDIVNTEIIVAQNQRGYILCFLEGPDVGEKWNFEAEGGCRIYGFPFGAFHLCLRNAGSNILQAREYPTTSRQLISNTHPDNEGIVHCPTTVSSKSTCITNTT